jgi:transposase
MEEMTELKKRKVHSAQFKAQVGIDAVRGTRTIAEIAQCHGVHPVMVIQWKNAILARAGTLFEAKRGPKGNPVQGDQARLWDEIARLQVELDWLKKKSGL